MPTGAASCGAQPLDDRWLFTGRHAVLQRIVTWMQADTPPHAGAPATPALGAAGALVVTGPAGCGKSAVMRHLAALSDPDAREQLLAHAPAGPDPDTDPGIGAVAATVDLHGMGERELATTLAEQLGLPRPQAGWQLIADLTRMAAPPIVLLDGLDEAVPEHLDKLATELLVALGTVARVVITTRQLEFLWYGPAAEGARVVGLQEMFGRDVPIIDLDAEPGTAADIEQYVARWLAAAGQEDLVQAVAPALAGRAGEFGGFLYAQVLTSQILRQVIDARTDGWQRQLAGTVGAALDREFSIGAPLMHDGAEVPGAARDLLHALAWGLGRGMPRQVWQVAASALSPDGVRYRAADLDWALEHYGCYVVEDEQHGEAVYRLAHLEFAEHLLGSPLPVPGTPQAWALAEELVALPGAKPPADGEPDRRSPYLRAYLTRHVSIAGTPGVDALYRLVKDTPE
ncbi:MAG TPA: ATP-binding protein, partial [Pseudonocardiaceae bacterium]|nr:ATP-binding protein [Pseudonocardiaceae bacterium]